MVIKAGIFDSEIGDVDQMDLVEKPKSFSLVLCHCKKLECHLPEPLASKQLLTDSTLFYGLSKHYEWGNNRYDGYLSRL